MWSLAALLVVAAHAGSDGYLSSRARPSRGRKPHPPLMLDLAPMHVAPEAVPMDSAEQVDSSMAEQSDEPVEKVEPGRWRRCGACHRPAGEVEPIEQTELAEPRLTRSNRKPRGRAGGRNRRRKRGGDDRGGGGRTGSRRGAAARGGDGSSGTRPGGKGETRAKPAQKTKPMEKQTSGEEASAEKEARTPGQRGMKKSAQNAPKVAAAAGHQGVGGSSMSPAKWENLGKPPYQSSSADRSRAAVTVQILFRERQWRRIIGVGGGFIGRCEARPAAVALCRRASPSACSTARRAQVKRTVRVPVVFR